MKIYRKIGLDEKPIKKDAKSVLFYAQSFKLFVANVHCYFKAKTHFCSCWCCPHNNSPLILAIHNESLHVLHYARSLKTGPMYLA